MFVGAAGVGFCSAAPAAPVRPVSRLRTASRPAPDRKVFYMNLATSEGGKTTKLACSLSPAELKVLAVLAQNAIPRLMGFDAAAGGVQ